MERSVRWGSHRTQKEKTREEMREDKENYKEVKVT
jgi:hypothetical protein